MTPAGDRRVSVKQTIVINADTYETRIAILEDDELAELFVERAEQRRHVGDIYKGRVNAVLPGMQAAFVDLGLTKTGFLHASDLSESLGDLEDISDLEENGGRRRRAPVPKIEDHLKKGQEVMVQITKESIGTKGPRVTQQVSLPGRFCVLHAGRRSRRRVAAHRGPRRAPAHQGDHHRPEAQGRRADRPHRRRGQGRSRFRRRREAPHQAVAQDRHEGGGACERRRSCTASSR